MSFDYNKSLWGSGTATLRLTSPTSFRLYQALQAVSSLTAGARVLEIGCGAGQFIRALKQKRPELDCHGVDISSEAIALAKTAQDGVNYEVSTEKQLPYAAQHFDAVLIFDVLEHVEDPLFLLTEAARVLKNHGVLYAFVPCEGDWLSWWHWLDKMGLKNNLTEKFAGHIQYFSRPKLLSIVAAAGFDLRRVRYSEHALGQLLGVVSFNLMNRSAAKQGISQLNNEHYFAELEHRTNSQIFSLIKNLVNSVINIESHVLARIPSPNLHFVAIKK